MGLARILERIGHLRRVAEGDDGIVNPVYEHDRRVRAFRQLERGDRLPRALVAALPEAVPETLCGAVAAQLAGYKVPRYVFLIDEVPRLPNGKADYKAARALLAELLAQTEEGPDG